MTAAEVADAHLPELSQMQGLRLLLCDSCISSQAHLRQLSQPVKLQRLKPQNCDSNWSCGFDGEETAKPQVVG